MPFYISFFNFFRQKAKKAKKAKIQTKECYGEMAKIGLAALDISDPQDPQVDAVVTNSIADCLGIGFVVRDSKNRIKRVAIIHSISEHNVSGRKIRTDEKGYEGYVKTIFSGLQSTDKVSIFLHLGSQPKKFIRERDLVLEGISKILDPSHPVKLQEDDVEEVILPEKGSDYFAVNRYGEIYTDKKELERKVELVKRNIKLINSLHLLIEQYTKEKKYTPGLTFRIFSGFSSERIKQKVDFLTELSQSMERKIGEDLTKTITEKLRASWSLNLKNQSRIMKTLADYTGGKVIRDFFVQPKRFLSLVQGISKWF